MTNKFKFKVYMKNHDTITFDCDFEAAEAFNKQIQKFFIFKRFIVINKLYVRKKEINFVTYERIEDAK